MSKQRASNDARGPGADVARLLRDLAVRERQLRDLTEQSLGFLEELAESRRLNAEREQLVQRLSELERALADARTRLRHAGGAATAGGGTAGKPVKASRRTPLAIVCWGAPARAAEAIATEAGVPVTWVGLPDQVPAAGVDRRLATIVHRDARTPAQCWNLAMAATTADAVLLLGPGLVPAAALDLPADLPANAALLCPRVERDGAFDAGLEPQDPLLRLRRRAAAADGEPLFRVPFADPGAFVVRRSAFERLGTFDEGLVGAAALVEYALRAQRANFAVFGVSTLALRADAGGEPPASLAVSDRERLVVLAMHRPDLLAQGLADVSLLWDMGREGVAGFLAQLLAKVPAAEGLPEQRAILERMALGLVQYGLPGSAAIAMLKSARVALLEGLAAAGSSREKFLTALRHVEADHPVDPAPVLAGLLQDVALGCAAFGGLARELEQARAETRAIDARRHEQSDRAERAEGARAHAQQQLETVQQWLREAQAETSAAHEARAQALARIEDVHRGAALVAAELGEVKRHRQNLDAQLKEALRVRDEREAQLKEALRARDEREAQLKEALRARDEREAQLKEALRVRDEREAQLKEVLRARDEREAQLKEALRARDERGAKLEDAEKAKARLAADLAHADLDRAQLAARVDQLQERVDAALAQHRELEREYLAADTELRACREQIARIAGLLGVVADAGPGNLQQRLEVVHEQAQQLGATLRRTGAADAAGLVQRLDDLGQRLAAAETVVRERERWIGLLLQEVAQRRLFPRQLQEHERAFVERTGRAT